ncbi:MAG: hypothetical protein RL434_2742 [Pseudomonadota bacterium]|jgi:hypothetical protein
MLDKKAALRDRLVESVTDYGLTQELTAHVQNRPSHKRKVTNEYYPSAEMHLAAARKLFPVCRDLWTA